jgi:biopolymer transport protein ExbB
MRLPGAALGCLWLAGCTVDWNALQGDAGRDAAEVPQPDAAALDQGAPDGGADLAVVPDVALAPDAAPDGPPGPTTRRSITIDRTRVGDVTTVTLTSYPLLVSVTDPDLRSRASGGQVASEGGDDLVFRALDAGACAGVAPCTLDHEIEAYDPAAGRLVAWVRIPALYGPGMDTSTVIYLHYGGAAGAPTQRPAAVWEPGFSGVWHFRESAGGLAGLRDSTANGNHGTPVNGVRLAAPGKVGPAIDLDGMTSYVEMPDRDSLDLSSAGTASVWFKARVAGTWKAMLSKGPARNSSDTLGNYAFEISPMDELVWLLGNSMMGLEARGPTLADVTAFHHVVLTWEAGVLRRYLDGILIEGSTTLSLMPGGNEFALRVGVYSDDRVDPFDGVIDELRISRVGRSGAWIVTDYNNQSDPASFATLGPPER